jgi:hypothetical protein
LSNSIVKATSAWESSVGKGSLATTRHMMGRGVTRRNTGRRAPVPTSPWLTWVRRTPRSPATP